MPDDQRTPLGRQILPGARDGFEGVESTGLERAVPPAKLRFRFAVQLEPNESRRF